MNAGMFANSGDELSCKLFVPVTILHQFCLQGRALPSRKQELSSRTQVVVVVDDDHLLYRAILRFRAKLTALLSLVVLSQWLTLFYSAFRISTQVVHFQHCLAVTWLVPRETAAVSARSVYTVQPCVMSRHLMQSHIRRVHACLAVSCHLRF